MTKTRKTKPAIGADNSTGTTVADLDGNPAEEASPAVVESERNADPQPVGPVEPAPATKPGGKQQQLAALVVRDEGATLDQMIAVTGWLPHTTRAALTGLKKKGHVIVRGKRGEVTCYRIAAV